MTTTTDLRIKDVAQRSGFSTATLRYYEQVGLLPAPQRTTAGYRAYDEAVLDRLRFIARAKQLGCSLEEVAQLTTAWEGGRCGPLQDRLRETVAGKLTGARRQIADLMTLTSDLQHAAAALERHRPDGACDERCGCVGDPEDPGPPQAVSLIGKPLTASEGDAPIACALDPSSYHGRLADWEAVLANVVDRERVDGGVRLVLDPATPLNELARLAVAEQDCCRFFRFAITVDDRGLALEVRAPDDAADLVDTVFGMPR